MLYRTHRKISGWRVWGYARTWNLCYTQKEPRKMVIKSFWPWEKGVRPEGARLLGDYLMGHVQSSSMGIEGKHPKTNHADHAILITHPPGYSGCRQGKEAYPWIRWKYKQRAIYKLWLSFLKVITGACIHLTYNLDDCKANLCWNICLGQRCGIAG